MTLIGAPGIGKSRLALELRRMQDDGAVTWLEARAAPYGDGLAFWPLAQLVKARAGILDSDEPRRASEKLRATVSSLGTANPEWMVEQLERLVAPAGRTQDDPGRDAAFAAWLRFLEALAGEAPLVLVFEDLQWADEGTLDFLAHLGASVVDAPLLVLCIARPELLERRPGWGGGARDAASITLAPLGTADVAELVTALLGGRADASTRAVAGRARRRQPAVRGRVCPRARSRAHCWSATSAAPGGCATTAPPGCCRTLSTGSSPRASTRFRRSSGRCCATRRWSGQRVLGGRRRRARPQHE